MASLAAANLPSSDEEDDDYDPSKDPTGEKDDGIAHPGSAKSGQHGRGAGAADAGGVGSGAAAPEQLEALTPAQTARRERMGALFEQLSAAATGSANKLSRADISLASLCGNTAPGRKRNTDAVRARASDQGRAAWLLQKGVQQAWCCHVPSASVQSGATSQTLLPACYPLSLCVSPQQPTHHTPCPYYSSSSPCAPPPSHTTLQLWMRPMGITPNTKRPRSSDVNGATTPQGAGAQLLTTSAPATAPPAARLAAGTPSPLPAAAALQVPEQSGQEQQKPDGQHPQSGGALRAAAAAALAAAKEGALGGAAPSYGKVLLTETRRFAGQDIQVRVIQGGGRNKQEGCDRGTRRLGPGAHACSSAAVRADERTCAPALERRRCHAMSRQTRARRSGLLGAAAVVAVVAALMHSWRRLRRRRRHGWHGCPFAPLLASPAPAIWLGHGCLCLSVKNDLLASTTSPVSLLPPPQHHPLAAMLLCLQVSVLDKTKLDWQDYKATDKGVQEELEQHRRSDKQYLERQEFLKRTELREYELERDKRLASDVRLRGRL